MQDINYLFINYKINEARGLGNKVKFYGFATWVQVAISPYDNSICSAYGKTPPLQDVHKTYSKLAKQNI